MAFKAISIFEVNWWLKSRMKACSAGRWCLTCLLAPSGANNGIGRASQFRAKAERSLNRPQHKIFAIVTVSSSFRQTQNDLKVIRMQRIVIRSWLGLRLRLGRTLQYFDSDDVPGLDCVEATTTFLFGLFPGLLLSICP
jgi:hypothetical protein